MMTKSITRSKSLLAERAVKSGNLLSSLYPICMPQSNITFLPAIVTIIQLLPTSFIIMKRNFRVSKPGKLNGTYLDPLLRVKFESSLGYVWLSRINMTSIDHNILSFINYFNLYVCVHLPVFSSQQP